MSNFVKRADKIVETTTNVLFIVVASFVVIVVGAALFRLLMGAVVDPIYGYLAPRMGLAFLFVVFAILMVFGALGEIVGEQLAEVPFSSTKSSVGKSSIFSSNILKISVPYWGC